MDTGWKPEARGRRMCEKSSLLFQDGALSSSEDRSTTAGCWDVMCVRRAYAKSPKRGVAFGMHLRNFQDLGRRFFLSTCRAVSCAEKVVREGRFVTGDI